MNTKLENTLLTVVRFIAFCIVCATLATHSPAARAQGVNVGDEAWGGDNVLYRFDGQAYQPTVTWRQFIDTNNPNAWVQYTADNTVGALYMDYSLADTYNWVQVYNYALNVWMGAYRMKISYSAPFSGNNGNTVFAWYQNQWITFGQYLTILQPTWATPTRTISFGDVALDALKTADPGLYECNYYGFTCVPNYNQ